MPVPYAGDFSSSDLRNLEEQIAQLREELAELKMTLGTEPSLQKDYTESAAQRRLDIDRKKAAAEAGDRAAQQERYDAWMATPNDDWLSKKARNLKAYLFK